MTAGVVHSFAMVDGYAVVLAGVWFGMCGAQLATARYGGDGELGLVQATLEPLTALLLSTPSHASALSQRRRLSQHTLLDTSSSPHPSVSVVERARVVDRQTDRRTRPPVCPALYDYVASCAVHAKRAARCGTQHSTTTFNNGSCRFFFCFWQETRCVYNHVCHKAALGGC